MAASVLKEKMRQKKPFIWAYQRIAEPQVTRLYAEMGVDCIVLDYQHYGYTDEQILNCSRMARACGASLLIRPYSCDPEFVGHILDLGVDGMIIAEVTSLEQAKSFIDSALFEPDGSRSLSGMARSNGYGALYEGPLYCTETKKNLVMFLMCESKDMVDQLDEYFKLESIDGFSIGPGDLAASYGYPGIMHNEVMDRIVDDVRNRILDSGHYCGMIVKTADQVREAMNKGIPMIKMDSELQSIAAELTARIKELVS